MPWTPSNVNMNTDKTSAHYRMVSALSDQEKLCSANPAAVADLRREVNLRSVAIAMVVPVVLATYHCGNGVRTVATHGMELIDNIATFAAACNDLCVDQATVIPNIKTHETLSRLAANWPMDDICFFVGVPLRNGAGQKVGSIAVMSSQKMVAQRGISFSLLNSFAKAFARDSKLPTAVLAQ